MPGFVSRSVEPQILVTDFLLNLAANNHLARFRRHRPIARATSHGRSISAVVVVVVVRPVVGTTLFIVDNLFDLKHFDFDLHDVVGITR